MLDSMVRAIKEYEDDLKACHEYYCKHNCAGVVGKGNHTPRCDKLRARWGFPEYIPASKEDGNV
jgi:hypothetical protein